MELFALAFLFLPTVIWSTAAVQGTAAAAAAVGSNQQHPSHAINSSSQDSSTGYYVSLDAPMSNETEYQGRSVRVRCEVTGFPLPRYRWSHNGQPLLPSVDVMGTSGRYDVKTTVWGSRLKISNLRLSDAGVYSCEGFNAYGRQSTSGYITVLPAPDISAEVLGMRDGGIILPGSRQRTMQHGGQIIQDGDSVDYADQNGSKGAVVVDDVIGSFDDDELLDDEEDDVAEDALFAAFDDDVDLLDSERSELERLAADVDRRRRRKGPHSLSPSTQVAVSNSDSRTAARHPSPHVSAGSAGDRSGSIVASNCRPYVGQLCAQYVGGGTKTASMAVYSSGPDGGRRRSTEAQLSATLALMATSGEFDRNDCVGQALPVMCKYALPTCVNDADHRSRQTEEHGNKMLAGNNDQHLTIVDGSRRRLPAATANRKYWRESNPRNGLKQQTMIASVEYLCREDCEDFERTVCKVPLDLVRRQAAIEQNRFLLPNCNLLPSAQSNNRSNCARVLPQQRHRTTVFDAGYESPTSVEVIHWSASYLVVPAVVVGPLAVGLVIAIVTCLCHRRRRNGLGRSTYKRRPGSSSSDETMLRNSTVASNSALAATALRKEFQKVPLKRQQTLDRNGGNRQGSVGFAKKRTPGVAEYSFSDDDQNENTVLWVDEPDLTKTFVDGELTTAIPAPNGIRLSRMLGAGAYGNMYVGHVIPGIGNDLPTTSQNSIHSTPTPVRRYYVKVLSPETAVPGVRETERLRQLDHPNIIRLVSVIGRSSEFHHQSCCLLYDYVDGGIDLVQYLAIEACRPPARRLVTGGGDWRGFVAVQVASALAYLSSRGLVHRDVAARNVIISGSGCRRRSPMFSNEDGIQSGNESTPEDLCTTSMEPPPTAKLSDFSLSRRPYATHYVALTMYLTEPDCIDGPREEIRLVPLRWSAPEAIAATGGGRHSEATDSWSFGVLLWELYVGRGLERPYDCLDDERLLDAVTATYLTGTRPVMFRLPIAGDSSEMTSSPQPPAAVRDLIEECLEVNPLKRPRFLSLVDRIRRIVTSSGSEAVDSYFAGNSSNETSPDATGSTSHLVMVAAKSPPPMTRTSGAAVKSTVQGLSSPNAAALISNSVGSGNQSHHHPRIAIGEWPASHTTSSSASSWWASSPTPSARRLMMLSQSTSSGQAAAAGTSGAGSDAVSSPLQNLKHYQLQQPTRMRDVVL